MICAAPQDRKFDPNRVAENTLLPHLHLQLSQNRFRDSQLTSSEESWPTIYTSCSWLLRFVTTIYWNAGSDGGGVSGQQW